MARFSSRSLARLADVDYRLRLVCYEAINDYDFTVLCGYRDEAAQNEAVERGHSRLRWPESKHNRHPAQAVDLAPWYPYTPHVRWERTDDFYRMATVILEHAAVLGVPVRWGGNWRNFRDYPHFELVEMDRAP